MKEDLLNAILEGEKSNELEKNNSADSAIRSTPEYVDVKATSPPVQQEDEGIINLFLCYPLHEILNSKQP